MSVSEPPDVPGYAAAIRGWNKLSPGPTGSSHLSLCRSGHWKWRGVSKADGVGQDRAEHRLSLSTLPVKPREMIS